jgi:hypothetical protein
MVAISWETNVPNWKEFRFKIDGEIDGVEITPYTIPLARIAVYLADLAQLLGHHESVHLIAVAEGSTQSVIYVDSEEESRVIQRVRDAQRGMGPADANRAYKKLDNKLRQDNATAKILNVSQEVEIIEFPGKNANVPQVYGPIRERASIIGELRRVGGFDTTVPVHLQRRDGTIFYCEANESIAKQLGAYLYRSIRVHGIATYSRGKEGVWRVDHFKIQSFDEEPLSTESFSATLDKLRAIPGSEWADLADPLEELHKIRHGEKT